MTSRTDANGNTVLYAYDALNRPTKKDYPTGVDVTYVYDEVAYPNAIGRLTRVMDGSGQKEYFYDRKGGR